MTTGNRRLAVAAEPVAVLLGYTVLALAICWPVSLHIESSVLGIATGDAAAGVWWYDALQSTGYHLVGTTVFDQVAYPFGFEQGNALNVQWFWPNFPTYLLAGVVGAVAAYNVAVIAGFALSGAAMYLLLRRIGCAPPVAAWGGFVFVILPWHAERAIAGHVTLVHLECLPLVLVAVHAHWRRPRPVALAAVAGAIVGCWITSGIFGVMAFTVAAACAASTLLLERPLRSAARRAGLLLVAAVAGSAVVYALSLPGGGSSGLGVAREVSDLSTYGLRPSELVVPAPRSELFGDLLFDYHLARLHGSNAQEATNYVGWLTLALALTGAVVAIRRRAQRPDAGLLATAMLIAAAGAFALAGPSPVDLGPLRVTHTPSWVVFEALPGFRVPARWSIVIALAMIVLAALGLESVRRLVAGRFPRPALPVVLLFAAAFLLSYAELSVNPGRFRFDAQPLPDAYVLLDSVPRGAVAEYPLVPNGRWENSQYLFWQRLHRRPLANGAVVHTHADDVRKTIVDPSAPGAASRLAALGVVAITTRRDVLSDEIDSSRLRRGAGAPGKGFELVGTSRARVRVWRVTAPPAMALATLPYPTFGDLAVVRGRVVQPLRRVRGRIEVDAPAPVRAAIRLTLFRRAAGTGTVTIAGRTFAVTSSGTPVCLPLSLASGRNIIPVSTTSSVGRGTGISATVPVVVAGCATTGTPAE